MNNSFTQRPGGRTEARQSFSQNFFKQTPQNARSKSPQPAQLNNMTLSMNRMAQMTQSF